MPNLVLKIIGGHRAVLQYGNTDVNGEKCLDMYHTDVPHQFRGHGIAKVLAKVGLIMP